MASEWTEWTGKRYDWRCDEHGHVEMSLCGDDDYETAGQGEAARGMLAELQHRGEKIERLMDEAEAADLETLRKRANPQLDGEAIGRGIVKELLPGVALSDGRLSVLVQQFGEVAGVAMGKAMRKTA